MCNFRTGKTSSAHMNDFIYFPNLDYAKLFMALLVVEIHVKPLSVFGSELIDQIIAGVDCIAVPFFFIASGFLCFRDLKLEQFIDKGSFSCNRVLATVKKLLFLYATWFTLMIPIDAFGYLERGESLLRAIVLECRAFVFVGEGPYSWPLWYLLASVVGFFLIFLLLRGGVRPILVLIIGAILLALGYLISYVRVCSCAPSFLSSAVDVYYSVFANVRNGVFEGFFYISLGSFFGMHWRPEGYRSHLVVALVLFSVGAVGCVSGLSDAHLPFCAAFASGVFLLSIRKVESTGKTVAAFSRKASTIIYLVHMPLLLLCAYWLFGLGGPYTTSAELPRMLLYLLTLALSFAVVTVVLSTSRRVPILKKLFAI